MDIATQQARKLARDGETESRASLSEHRRSILSPERIEDALMILGAYAATRVGHIEVDARALACARHAYCQHDIAAGRVLDRVREKIHEDLAKLANVGEEMHRFIVPLDPELQLFLLRERANKIEALLHDSFNPHRLGAHHLLARFDARIAEQLLHELQRCNPDARTRPR